MARHVEFGNHPNTSVVGIIDDAADFVLRVVEAVGAESLELRKELRFDAEALIVGQVPMEDVEFHGGHAVEVAADDGGGHEVAGNVDEKAPPGEAGMVVDGDAGNSPPVLGVGDELREGFESVESAEWIGRGDFSFPALDGEMVALVLVD